MTQIKELVARGSGYTIFAPAAAHDFVGRGELVKSPIIDRRSPAPCCGHQPRAGAKPGARAVIDLTVTVARDLVRRGIWEGRLVPELDTVAG